MANAWQQFVAMIRGKSSKASEPPKTTPEQEAAEMKAEHRAEQERKMDEGEEAPPNYTP